MSNPVFNKSGIGDRLTAERPDEAGDELVWLGYEEDGVEGPSPVEWVNGSLWQPDRLSSGRDYVWPDNRVPRRGMTP